MGLVLTLSNKPTRTIRSIEHIEVQYPGFTKQVKLITLDSGLSGIISLDRLENFVNAVFENKEGEAEIPLTWKVGKLRWGLPYGYWYNSEVLQEKTKLILL